MTTPTYQREFPDYGALDFSVPEGFTDSSWHNDACPSWTGKEYVLFADYKDVAQREIARSQRFALCNVSDERGTGEFLLGSDNFEEITAFIAATEGYSIDQRAFIGKRISRAKAEILHVVISRAPFYPGGKVVPEDIVGFSDLHDYCDANELGDLCDDKVSDEGNRLFPECTDGDTILTQGYMAACEVIQSALHLWIVNGTMRQQAQALRSSTIAA